MRKIQLEARVRRSRLHRRMHAHKGDVSEGTAYKLIAKKKILGKTVLFFNDGYREVMGLPVDDEEAHNSEILRFAHASILINQPVGDKAKCYVDATKDPVEVWVYGIEATTYINGAKKLIRSQVTGPDFFLDQSLQEIAEPLEPHKEFIT